MYSSCYKLFSAKAKYIFQRNYHLSLNIQVPYNLCLLSSRIICTDSTRHSSLQVKSEEPREAHHSSSYVPSTFVKDSFNLVDSRYFKLVEDAQKLEDVVCIEEFKNVLTRVSFTYDVNLAEKITSTRDAHYYYAFKDINSACKMCETKGSDNKVYMSSEPRSGEGKASEAQLLHVINSLTHSLLSFFEKPQDYSIYHRNIIFINNIKGVTTKGLTAYMQAMYVLRVYGKLQYARVGVHILKVTHHLDDSTVRVRWRVTGLTRSRMLMNMLKMRSSKWNEIFDKDAEWMDGFSVFSVDADGLVYRHICDKMQRSDDTVPTQKSDLKSRLMSLLDLGPRGSAAGNLSAVASLRTQELTFKKMT